MKYFPHLPPESCSVNFHRMYTTIEWIIFVAVLGVLAGIAGTFVAIAWLLPTTPVSVSFFSSVGMTQKNSRVVLTINPLIAQQVDQRIVTVYDSKKMITRGVYTQNALIGKAIFVSSDGWIALYAPHLTAHDYLSWRIIDNQHVIHAITRMVQDPLSGVTYLKVNGTGFRVTRFSSLGSIHIGSSLWAYTNGSWQEVRIDRTDQLVSFVKEQPIWQRTVAYHENLELYPGTILVHSDGSFVGFVGVSGNILSSFYLNNQISSLLAHEAIVYTGLAVYGYPVTAIQSASTTRSIFGWYVTRSMMNINKTSINIGDVIEKINNQSLDQFHLTQQILSLSHSPISVTIFRKGKEYDILVPVLPLHIR